MSTEYLLRLGQQRSQTRLIRFDEQPVAQAPVEGPFATTLRITGDHRQHHDGR